MHRRDHDPHEFVELVVERRDLARNPLAPGALAAYAAAVFDPPRAGAMRQAAVFADSTLG